MTSENELSEREIEILRLVATGVGNKEIALRLAISPNTVKVHLRNIFTKIGVSSRTEAVLMATRMGLVEQTAVYLVPESETESEPEETPPSGLILSGIPDTVETIEIRNPVHPRRKIPGWFWIVGGIVGLMILGLSGLALTHTGPFALSPQATITVGPTALPVVPQPTPSRWSEISALPAGRSGMAAAVYEGAIYVMAGQTKEGVTGTVVRYRPSPGGWETLAEKPTPVSDVRGVVLGERIFVPGGKDANGKPLNIFEAYSPRINQWNSLAPLPAALSGYALAAYEGRLYLFGGWDGTAYSAAVYSYDPTANTWKTLSPLPAPRAFAIAALVESKIYVVGGFDGQQALRDVLVYFPQRDLSGDHPWENRAPLPEGRYGMGAASLANYIYLIGGVNDAQNPGALSPLQYHTLGDRWATFGLPPSPVGANPAVLALDTRLHVLGGLITNSPLANQQTYQAIYTVNLPSVQE
jgi:DNA-binding CsgD family transcriptional regulator